MECGWHDFGFKDTDGGRQSAIESAEEVLRRDAGVENEAGHLGEGVDAGVSAAGALGKGALAGDAGEGVGERALDGRASGLDLPAVEGGPVVGEGQFPVHGVRD